MFERVGLVSRLSIVCQLASLWPVCLWMVRRGHDGSDEPWGAIALITLLVVVWSRRCAWQTLSGLLPSLATLAYAVSLPNLSPLPRGLLGLLALSLTLSRVAYGARLQPGILGLSLLSLPLIASADFYAGYPLRLVTAELARGLLELSGFAVIRDGVSLLWLGQEVAVDPACSGIRMLWVSAYVTSTLACIMPLPWRRAWLAIFLVSMLVVLANAWRTAALFHLEAGRITLPSWAHEAIGTVIFVVTLAAIAVAWHRLFRGALVATPHAPHRVTSAPERRQGSAIGLLLAAVAALALSFVSTKHQQKASSLTASNWPAHFEGEALTPDRAQADLEPFYRAFPGKVAFFRSGEKRLVWRWLTTPTRKLHPAQHCYRASGYFVSDAKQCTRADRHRYGCFTATRQGRATRVSERIFDATGKGWTDVSAWYFAAVLGQTQGPWYSVTIAEPGS